MSQDVIEVVSYNAEWPFIFATEKDILQPLLTKIKTQSIEHIGSTAVKNLAAKPTIDILIGVKTLTDVDPFIPEFKHYGYNYLKSYEKDFPYRRYFRKLQNHKHLFHLHVVEFDGYFYQINLLRRDYLREHPEEIEEYAKLKNELAKKFTHNRLGYTEAKDEFIDSLTRKAIVWDAMLRGKEE